MIRPDVKAAQVVKTLLNIGATLDIPTGFPMVGIHGQTIIVGGLGMMTGIMGGGNSFKSTLADYMNLSAMSRILSTCETSYDTYDTEINIHEHHKNQFVSRFPVLAEKDILTTGLWTIADKTDYYANQIYEKMRAYAIEKRKHEKKTMVDTPFCSREDRSKPMRAFIPNFWTVDSFTEFETEKAAQMQEENELGDSGANTLHMRMGADKTRFLMDITTVAGGCGMFVTLVAHVGQEIQMASGPVPQAPKKKLAHLKNGDKGKGVTDKFYFLMNNCWHAYRAEPFLNKGTNGPEYPAHQNDTAAFDPDLNLLSIRQLRSKSGPTGITLDLVVSQNWGILPELTEFNYIKNRERFGISGSLQHYNLDLLPDVSLSRTTVRNKIDNNARLRRALNITSEIAQIQQHWRAFDPSMLVPMGQLQQDLTEMGYNWDMILDNTRGWYTFNDDKHPVPFLSSVDILKMRAGKYIPFWFNEEQKSKIKPPKSV